MQPSRFAGAQGRILAPTTLGAHPSKAQSHRSKSRQCLIPIVVFFLCFVLGRALVVSGLVRQPGSTRQTAVHTEARGLRAGDRSIVHTDVKHAVDVNGAGRIDSERGMPKQAMLLSAPPPLPPLSDKREAHTTHHAEYDGTVIRWGADHLQDSVDDCAAACVAEPRCNVFVYCGNTTGCATGRLHRECWLKRQEPLNLLALKGAHNPTVRWSSGAIYSPRDMAAATSAEKRRLDGLLANASLPIVFFDVAIKGKPVGRIKMLLYTHISPLAAENMRALCTGEKGIAPAGHEGAGQPYHFKGKPFYRIIDRFIDQTGVGTDSVYGGQFKDDPAGLKLKHNRKGLLSMANMGHDTNTSHFSILMGPAPHLDGSYTIFGEVIEGFDVVDAINALSFGQKDNTAGPDAGAIITDSGQLR